MGARGSSLKNTRSFSALERYGSTNSPSFGLAFLSGGGLIMSLGVASFYGNVYNMENCCKKWSLHRFVGRQQKAELTKLINEVQADFRSRDIVPFGLIPEKKAIFDVQTKSNGGDRSHERKMLHVDIAESRHLSLFICPGYTPIHRGHRTLKNGATIGLPQYFMNTSVDDVTSKTNDDEEVLSSEPDCLTLSKDAKKFAIGRELFILQTSPSYVFAQFGAIVVAATVLSAVALTSFGTTMKIAAQLLSVTGYLMTRPRINEHYSRGADDRVAAISQDYHRGAVEYYTKAARREQLLAAGLASPEELQLKLDVTARPSGTFNIMARLDKFIYRDWVAASERLKRVTMLNVNEVNQD